MADSTGRQERPAYLYFPGCTMKATGVAYGESVLELFRLLDLPLEELDDWNCCGATSYMSIDEHAAFVLSGRNLSLAHRAGPRDLVVPCTACFLMLRKTQEYILKYPAIQQEVAGALSQAGLPPIGPVRVRHPLDVLYTDVGVEKIRALVTRRWHGGRVACYYGCQALRPYAEADKAHNPMRMDELLQAVGVETIDFPLKTKCCGGSLTGTIHEVGVRLNYILLKEVVRRGGQGIATMCSLCQFNLDAYQAEMRKEAGEVFDVPIVYFTQILGWALGGDARALGLHRSIAGRHLIREWFATPKEVEAYV
jgi:heterodisulfide reductase subunit B